MDPRTLPSNGPPLWKSLQRLVFGMAYLAAVAGGFSGAARVPYLWMLLAVLVGTVFCTTLALVWLTRSALRGDGRKGQFGLASLFLLTTFAAVYFGAVRSVVVSSVPLPAGRSSHAPGVFVLVGAICFVLAALAIPFVVAMADSLVWFAVWIVRRPSVRRWLRERRSRPHEDGRDI